MTEESKESDLTQEEIESIDGETHMIISPLKLMELVQNKGKGQEEDKDE